MQKYFIFFMTGFIFLITTLAYGSSERTHRVTEFTNEKVNVWKTTIYPSISQTLTMHRHEYNRVLIALDDGVLKIKNDKGKVHYLNLVKNKVYYLKKDIPNELHSDENTTNHPINVLVIELKS